MPVDLLGVIELICLVYHEAQNRSPKVKAEPKYAKLVSLPGERCNAWREMKGLRATALRTGLVKSAVWVFEDFFDVEMTELAPLFKKPIWRPGCGGAKWAAICSRVSDLAQTKDTAQIEAIYQEILSMPHNTGSVGDKLRKLRLC